MEWKWNGEWKFPLKINNIRFLLQPFLNKSGKRVKRFPDNLTGINWPFMLGHPNLTIKLAENTKSQSATNIGNFEKLFQRTRRDITRYSIHQYTELC